MASQNALNCCCLSGDQLELVAPTNAVSRASRVKLARCDRSTSECVQAVAIGDRPQGSVSGRSGQRCAENRGNDADAHQNLMRRRLAGAAVDAPHAWGCAVGTCRASHGAARES